MPDLLDSIRDQLRARLDELRPLVSEYERLHQAAQALRSNRPAAESRTQARNARRPRRSRARPDHTSNTATERSNSRTTLLALIGARPGITKAELKTASGLSSGSVAQNVRRLVARGELREESLSGDQTGYRLSDTDNAGTSK